MKFRNVILSLVAFMIAAVFVNSAMAQAVAQVQAQPNVDVAGLLLNLVTNFKTMGPLGISMVLINLVIALLKSDALSNVFKKVDPLLKLLILVILGQIAGIINYMTTEVAAGKSTAQAVLSSVIYGLITTGGAMAIYESYNQFKKQAKV